MAFSHTVSRKLPCLGVGTLAEDIECGTQSPQNTGIPHQQLAGSLSLSHGGVRMASFLCLDFLCTVILFLEPEEAGGSL